VIGKGKGVVASFWLVPENSGNCSFLQVGYVNQGVLTSFRLVSNNTGSWSFLQVGACKLGSRSLLPFAAGEFREL
jgi:hypothetical protein